MEFHVALTAGQPDLTAFEDALLQVDPGAVFALTANNQTLSVSAFIEAADLGAMLHAAGCPVTPDQIELLPSLCCGGCST